MAVEVGEGFGVVGDHRVEVEGLRVGQVGVGDGSGNGGPVGGEPAAEAVGVVAGAEIVVAGFGVAFLSLEFVVLRAGASVRALAAVGVEVGVVAYDAGACGKDTGSAKKVFDVVQNSSARNGDGIILGAAGNVPFPEEDAVQPELHMRVNVVVGGPISVDGDGLAGRADVFVHNEVAVAEYLSDAIRVFVARRRHIGDGRVVRRNSRRTNRDGIYKEVPIAATDRSSAVAARARVICKTNVD